MYPSRDRRNRFRIINEESLQFYEHERFIDGCITEHDYRETFPFADQRSHDGATPRAE